MVSPSPKAVDVKKILATTEKSINYKSFYGTNPNILSTSPVAVKDIFGSSTLEGFHKPNNGNMDAWKLMVRDDVIRFQHEQQEKRERKR
jgi:hypothetical protein